MYCQLDLVCHADQQKGKTSQQAAENASCKRSIAHYVFNPNAPAFVSTRMFKGTNQQTQKCETNCDTHNTASIAPQAKGSVPDKRSVAHAPASPRIAAKMAAPSSQKHCSTQEAPVRPPPMQSAAVDTAPTAAVSKQVDSTNPSISQSAAEAPSTTAHCARDSGQSDGKEQQH